MRLLASAIAICLVAVAARASDTPKHAPVADAVIGGDELPKTLSAFGFFKDTAGESPNEGVMPYKLNAPLFSDYAEKFRFIYIPDGKMATAVSDSDLVDFPVGSALIKSFGYQQGGKMKLLETRVLLHRADGWLALPYIWNEEQTEATLKVAGKRIAVNFTDPSGKPHDIQYGVPNKNQCKECHSLKDAVMPIGPKLRNLESASIAHLVSAGKLQMPASVAAMPDYADTSAPLHNRARSYLDINCAHCHNRQGSASNSGLFLTYQEPIGPNLGIGKRPTAAGRGSGGLEFAIAPGKPDESYLMFRMKSLEPGIAMPEVGRSTMHAEGVELLGEWIAEMGQ